MSTELQRFDSPSVSLKLSPRGIYSWTIKLPIPDGAGATKVIKQLESFDSQLKLAFPDHAKKYKTSQKSFNILE